MVMCVGCFESFDRDDVTRVKTDNEAAFYCTRCSEKYTLKEE